MSDLGNRQRRESVKIHKYSQNRDDHGRTVRKVAVNMNISRDMAIAYGLVEPTAEERAEQEEWSRRYDERRQAARLRKGEWLAALNGTQDPALRAVIEHHALDGEYGSTCRGCDQGCSCDSAEWPCSTITTILDALGVDTTDIYLADWRSDT